MRRSRSKTFTGRRAQPCRATAAAAAVAAAGFLVVCPDVAAAAASGAISGRPLETVIVVDAGSSGCRLNVYQVEWEGESMSVSGTSGGKIEPGLNSFADRPADAAEHVRPLLVKASELVPAEKHSSTKIYIKSTAGMRLLPEETQEAIYNEIYDALAGDPSFPFGVQRGQLGTIDGDMEAFYAVLSANFLEERIDARLRSTSHHGGEVGALDMGGASTQIIFRPKREEVGAELAGQERPQDTMRDADGVSTAMSPDDFWSASHLGYGVAEVRMRVWAVLIDEHVRASPQDHETMSEGEGKEDSDGEEKRTVENPCSFVNRVDSWKGFLLVGTGDYSSCERMVRAALWRDEDLECGLEADRACGWLTTRASCRRRSSSRREAADLRSSR